MKKDFKENTVDEFISRCDNAIGFKESTDDIENCKSLKEWLKKWEGATDDDYAYQLAEEHFNKAIELYKGFGIKSYLGQAYLSLGSLYKATKRTDQARQCILKAIDIFQECEAEGYLKQANEALDSLA